MDSKRRRDSVGEESKRKILKSLNEPTFHKCKFCDARFRRADYLKKHVSLKHSSSKRYEAPSTSNFDEIPSTQSTEQEHQSENVSLDHNYAGHGNRDYTGYDNYNTSGNSIIHSDHNYAGHNDNLVVNPHSTSTTTSINRLVQDHEILPNGNEQYDILTFLANVQSIVARFLKSRVMLNPIKWYLSIQVELVKDDPELKTSDPHFRSKSYITLNLQTYEEHMLNESYQKMFESFEKYIRDSSGWTLKRVKSLIIHTVDYTPLSASSFMELPKKLRRFKSLLNIRNLDQKCFLWSCLASLHPLDSSLVSDYEPYENELDMKGMHYPVSIHEVGRFEKQNPNLSVNIFAFEDGEVIPLRISSKIENVHHVDLLLLHSDENSHYVLIKNFNNFLSYMNGKCNKKFFCRYCLHGFSYEKSLNDHKPYCQVHGEQKVELPTSKDCLLEFKDFEKTLRIPYVIYADFETLNKRLDQDSNASTTRTQLLEPCSFGYKVISTDPQFSKDTVIYKGPDAPQKLLECLFKESEEIEQRLQNIKPLVLTEEEERNFQNSKTCCICNKLFIDSDTKVRHHEHTVGNYLGASHSHCNLQCKQVKFIPVVFHNLKNFDSHLLCQGMGPFQDKRIKCIPQTMEKYISFSIGKLRFIDSFAFLPSSLESLASNLVQNDAHPFQYFSNEIQSHKDLLLRKGIYPYQYIDCWEKFNEEALPPREEFYSDIKREHISQADYNHALEVYEKCECETIADYHDLYLKVDVLLLTEVMEHFRDVTHQYYQLDPFHFYTSPGLSWSAMLKMTGVTLQLMTDIDQILFVEKAIRGGISLILNRYAKANNPYLNDFDSSKDTSYLNYYDVNNLYGLSLCQKLPVGFFRFLDIEEINNFNVKNIPQDGSKGYILEVDLDYPESLHDSHNDYPLAPEHKSISSDQLSPYAKAMWKKLHGKAESDALPPRAKVEKLLTTLEDKKNYVLHYRNLQLYLQLGLKLKKIYRILEFEQVDFMRPYIEFNTMRRQEATNQFEKDYFKLLNNSCFGKTMENLRKHRTVELCNTARRVKKLSAKSTYKSHRIFSENLVGIELNRHKVKLNKPIYVGMSVLDLSKHTMYDFYYNHLKQLYGDSVQLQMTDTDSFLFLCKTDDVFEDMHAHSHLFDTSDFPKKHYLHSNINKKVMGKMKSETIDKVINEFCGLRSKNYSYTCDGKEDKRAKGISRIVVENELSINDYKNTLFNKTSMKSNMHLLRSHNHQIFCENVCKISLSSFDDKRYLLEDGISSLAYGHYRIKQV